MMMLKPFDSYNLAIKTYLWDARKSVVDESKKSTIYLSDKFKNHLEIYQNILKLAAKYGYWWTVSRSFRKGSA